MGEEKSPRPQEKKEEGEEEEERMEERCDSCGESKPLVYCRADSARLCLRCDRHVHAANSVSSRHRRSLLCDACRAAPSAFLCASNRRPGLLLCSNCDFDAHRGAPDGRHDRRPIEGFSGCPSAAELVSLLGVGGDEKALSGPHRAGEDDGGSGWAGEDEGLMVWETQPVFSLNDLIVPTTSCYGFQAMGNPPLPKHRSSTCGKHKEEIMQQLHELIQSENPVKDDLSELEPVVRLQYLVPQQNLQLSNLGRDVNHDAPTSQDGMLQWDHIDSHGATDTLERAFPYKQHGETSSMVNPSRLIEIADLYASPSHASSGDRDKVNAIIGENIHSLPPKGGRELVCPDRGSVISRYKEKRKTRRYDKLIRYESRKIRADSRTRIKGRFAKANQVNRS